MVGYVGEKARRRRRRYIYIVFFIIIFFIFIYFNYNINDEKIEIDNNITSIDDTNDTEQSSIDNKDFQLKIIEIEQKVNFRDQQIKSFKSQINILTKEKNNIIKEKNDLLEEKNNLLEQNKKLLVSLNTLNSKIDKNLQIKEDVEKEKVKELDFLILQLKKENKKILDEYNNIVQKNLELNLQLKSLNIEKKEKVLQLEQLINDQKEIIETLKPRIPH